MPKLLLALLTGALGGAVATRAVHRQRRAGAALPAVVTRPGPDRVAVDVSAFVD